MAAPLPFDVDTVATASATVGVAPAVVAAAIATLLATAACPHPPLVAFRVSAHAGPAVGVAGSLAAAATADAPAWPSFDPSMGRALYWSTPHAFFAAPQYGFSV
jgi:hypothetical protein